MPRKLWKKNKEKLRKLSFFIIIFLWLSLYKKKAPLISLPIIEELFERMDCYGYSGTITQIKARYQYILVICDYATRYPEAFLLKNFTAPAVAEKLIELFSPWNSTGNTDNKGTNFTLSLLQEIYKMLGVHPITTPYHPQTDGLVERFNKTLKQMLRKFVTEELE